METELKLLLKYQPKKEGDLGWDKLFLFKCEIKNYSQIANVWLGNYKNTIQFAIYIYDIKSSTNICKQLNKWEIEIKIEIERIKHDDCY